MAENKVQVGSSPGTIRFTCPNCGKAKIVRSQKHRISAVRYKCPECSFEGPN